MKKLISIFLTLSVALLTFCGCSEKDASTVRVNEVTHSVFYAPFYVAIEKGYFAEEGINIELTNGGGSDASMTALLSNSADIALLGPETGVYTLQGGAADCPLIFAQLTKRDGSFLMGRVEEKNFKWTDLIGKEIIAGRRGGSPAMSLEYALNKNGLINGKNVVLNFDVQFNLTVPAFERGTGDYVTMFEPTASEYVRNGKGYMIASVGEESGEVPFTCFMAKKTYIEKNKDTVEKFTKAVYKAIKYIMEEDEKTVAEGLVTQFPSTSLTSISDSIASYKRIDAWKTKMTMLEKDFDRLQDVMINAGELQKKEDFSKLVYNEIAEKTYSSVFN